MVSPEVWEAVQERLAGNVSRLGGNPETRYLLGVFTRCACCGGADLAAERKALQEVLPAVEAAAAYLEDIGRRFSAVLRSDRFSIADKRALLSEVETAIVMGDGGRKIEVSTLVESGETTKTYVRIGASR